MKSVRFPDLPVARSPAEWAVIREGIVGRWLDLLGRFPAKVPLNSGVRQEIDTENYRRQLVRYQVAGGKRPLWVEAFLLLPGGAIQKSPAVVVFHETTPETIRSPAGLVGPSSLHMAVHLVARGYVALCPRNFLWDDNGSTTPADGVQVYQEAVRRLKGDFPDWTGMGRMLWDGMRSVDYLESRPEVDARRIGCIGFSLGAKEVLYLGGFDQRIQAAVSVEGGIGLDDSNWHDSWYLGDHKPAPDSGMDHHEILALCAPRAFLLIGGNEGPNEDDGKHTRGADGEWSRSCVEAARPVYRLFSAGDRLDLLTHFHGHSFPQSARARAYDWLDRFLKADAGATVRKNIRKNRQPRKQNN